MTREQMKQSPAVLFLLGVLTTVILAVAAFGFNSIEKKVDKTVFDIHSQQQIRSEDKASAERKEILQQVGEINKKL